MKYLLMLLLFFSSFSLVAAESLPKAAEFYILCGDLKLRFDASRYWNCNRYDYRDRQLTFDADGAHQGMVIKLAGSKGFIGSGHKEMGIHEEVEQVSIQIDGKPLSPVKIKDGEVIRAEKNLKYVKKFKLNDLSVSYQLECHNCSIVETYELSAEKPVKLELGYLFMHLWNSEFQELWSPTSGTIAFSGDNKFHLRKPERFVGFYNRHRGIAALSYLTEIPAKSDFIRMIWDRKNDNKDYTRFGFRRNFEQNVRERYQMITEIVPAESRTAFIAASEKMINAKENTNMAPILEYKGVNISNAEHAEYHPDYKCLLSLPGTDTAAKVSVESKVLNPEEFTLTAWIMPRKSNAGYRTIVFKGDRSAKGDLVDFKFGLFGLVPEFGFKVNGEWHGILRYLGTLSYAGNKIPLEDSPSVIAEQWNFIAISFDRGKIRIFLNGNQCLESQTSARHVNWSNSPIMLGCGQLMGGRCGFHMNGLLDKISFWNQVLDAKQINELYQQTKINYNQKKVIISDRKKNLDYDPKFQKKLKSVVKYEQNSSSVPVLRRSPDMTIGLNAGIPSIFYNGIAQSAMGMIPAPSTDNNGVFLSSRDFAASGIDYYSEIFWAWKKFGDSCSLWWTGYEKYDFARIEARLTEFVKANPNAKILIRIKLDVPEWWLQENPEERVVDQFGNKGPQPSLSSQKWLDDTSKMLGDFVKHMENSYLAPYIVGYIPAGGSTSEWFWWGYKQGLVDYSPANLNSFRKYLKEQYKSDFSLARAWNARQVTIETAKIPTPDHRVIYEDGFFRDVLTSRQNYDYQNFMSKATTNAIRKAALTIRNNQKTRKLIGTFYGYSLVTGSENLGFGDLKSLLEDSNIDFLCGPTVYDRRRASEEGDYCVMYLASMKLHNKVYYDEADMRTYLSSSPEIYRTPTLDETLEVHWRTFGNALTQGVNIWWFLIAGNATFHSEPLMNQIAKFSALDKKLLNISKKSNAEIAFFCDEESMHYYRSSRIDQEISPRFAMISRAKLGAPSDVYLLSDFTDEKLPDYKLYVFLNAYFITPEQRKAIQCKISKNKAVALWFYAPGYLSPNGNAIKQMGALTGFDFKKFMQSLKGEVEISLPKHPLSASLKNGTKFISPTPAFTVVEDIGVESVAKLAGETVLAIRDTTWGKSIYSSLPLSAAMLREASRMAGVHIYMETGDIFRANENFIMIHATASGEKIIRLPIGCKVQNLKTAEILPVSKQITLNIKKGETVLFKLMKTNDIQ